MNIAPASVHPPNEGAAPLPVGVSTTPRADELRPRIVSSDELLQGRRELWIEHRGELYRLRVTAAGKLYMTK